MTKSARTGEVRGVGGEGLHRHPGGDEKPAVVDHPVQMGLPLRRGPADILVPHAQGAGGGAEGQGRHGPPLEAREVLEAMPYQPLIPQVMIAADHLIPQRLRLGVAGHRYRHRRPGPQIAANRRTVDGILVRRGAQMASGSKTFRHADVVTGARRRPPVLPNDAFPLGKRMGPSLTRPDASYGTCGHLACLPNNPL